VKFNHRGAQKKSRQGNLTHQSTPPAKLTKSVIGITVFPRIGPSWFRALPLPVSLPTPLEE
jgi:hypothetical protein